MDRLEFRDKTPTPMIKGTDYGAEFALRDQVRRRIEATKAAGFGDNPFSALYDYTEEEEKAAQRKEKAQATQQKIMRTNALGEAFRVLGEGMSARQGAPVTPRNPNPFILNAVNEYAKSDLDYINKLEGISAKKLALGQADLQYKIGKADKEADKEAAKLFQMQREQNAREWETINREAAEAKQLAFYYRQQKDKANAEGDARAAELFAKKEMATLGAALEVENYKKKKQIEMEALTQGPSTNKTSDKDVGIVSPETGTTHYFRPEYMRRAAYLLQQGMTRFQQQVPKVVRDALAGKGFDTDGLAIEIQNNWNIAKYALPEYAAALQNAQFQNMQQGGTGALSPGLNQPAGAGAGQPAGPVDPGQQLLADVKVILEGNWTDTKKLRDIRNAVEESFKKQGKLLPPKDISEIANEFMRDWRQSQRSNIAQDSTKVQ